MEYEDPTALIDNVMLFGSCGLQKIYLMDTPYTTL